MNKKRFLVTGDRGFIGSHFTRKCLEEGHEVIGVDMMDYPAHKELPWDNHPNYTSFNWDISEMTHLPQCNFLVNFAASSHVDNSISSPEIFEKSNVRGVLNLLNLVKGKTYNRPLFIQISTDEVYGDAEFKDEPFTENSVLNPSSPYSASKAAAEMFIMSYGRTYGINYQIVRSTNNYGPRQYPEKLIPKILDCLNRDEKIPIHGNGSYVREWLYVEDNVDAIYEICMQSDMQNLTDVNEIWNVSSKNKMTNLDVVKEVCGWLKIVDWKSKVEFIENRHGQDGEYDIDSTKVRDVFNWEPRYDNKLHNFLTGPIGDVGEFGPIDTGYYDGNVGLSDIPKENLGLSVGHPIKMPEDTVEQLKTLQNEEIPEGESIYIDPFYRGIKAGPVILSKEEVETLGCQQENREFSKIDQKVIPIAHHRTVEEEFPKYKFTSVALDFPQEYLPSPFRDWNTKIFYYSYKGEDGKRKYKFEERHKDGSSYYFDSLDLDWRARVMDSYKMNGLPFPINIKEILKV